MADISGVGRGGAPIPPEHKFPEEISGDLKNQAGDTDLVAKKLVLKQFAGTDHSYTRETAGDTEKTSRIAQGWLQA